MRSTSFDDPAFKLLHASIDPDSSGDIHILVNGKLIKYIILESGAYGAEYFCFESSLLALVPQLSDWDGMKHRFRMIRRPARPPSHMPRKSS